MKLGRVFVTVSTRIHVQPTELECWYTQLYSSRVTMISNMSYYKQIIIYSPQVISNMPK